MKYIVLQMLERDLGLVREIPIIFPEALVHAEVAQALQTIPSLAKAKPISAGQISSMAIGDEINDGVFCYGKSETLHLQARPREDSHLIEMMDYHHGIV